MLLSQCKEYVVNKLLSSFVLVLAFSVPLIAQAYTGVTVVMTVQTPANQEFIDQLNAELNKNKLVNLRVNVITLADTDKLVVAENSELVIALGVKALEAASKLKNTTPVLGVFTPLAAFNSVMGKSRRELGSFSAIAIDQPYARQMALIMQVMPAVKKVGILFGQSSIKYADYLSEEAEERGLTVLQEKVNEDAELIPKLKKILETSDVLLAVPDSAIYSRETAQPILLTSYRYQKPIFGYSQSYVRAGAIAAVFTTSAQLARQAAEIALKSRTSPSELPPPQMPKYFSIMLNYQVARSLNIPLKDEAEIIKGILESDEIEIQENEESRH